MEHGSFRGAADELRLSVSTASHQITQLEAELDVTLLYRSTRKLSLTPEGERLLPHARQMLEAADNGLAAVGDSATGLNGRLRVTMPAVLAGSEITARIARFMSGHSGISLELDISDMPRDLVGSGIDVAFRMGWLKDSGLKARTLYQTERLLLAAEGYLDSRPAPQTPEDLASWDWLELTPVSLKPVFEHADGRRVSLRPRPRISSNNAAALYHLLTEGAGLAILPRFMAEAGLRTGQIRSVLPDWKHRAIGVHAVRPGTGPGRPLVTAFLDHLARPGLGNGHG